MPGHHHRSGPLRQTNKRNKRSKSSKRSVTRLAGGKVEGRKAQFKANAFAHSKADRRNIQQQRREAKRLEIIRLKRGLDGGPAPPRIVGIISLGQEEATEETLRSLILQQADTMFLTSGEDNKSTISARYESLKKDGNLTVLTNSTAFKPQYSGEQQDDAAVMAALDLCRVCDVVLFVIDGDYHKDEDSFVGMDIGGDDASQSTRKTNGTAQAFDHIVSERGDKILAAVKGQGIPRVVTILARTETDLEAGDDHMTMQSAKSIRRHNLKRKQDLKKYISRFATTEFGVDNDKVLEVNLRDRPVSGIGDEEMDDQRIVDTEEHSKRTLAAALVRTICTLNACPTKWVSELPRAYLVSDKHEYDDANMELHLTGYVRGAVPLDVNSLVHVPNLGTFACKCIRKAAAPTAGRSGSNSLQNQQSDVIESDPMKQESLERFAAANALDGEQNLVGFDEADGEFEGDEGHDDLVATNFARPAGWSDYQSAWLDAVDGADDFDHGELAKELNRNSTESVAPDSMDLDDANRISKQERQALMEQRRKQQQEHQDFPDEVQVNEDEKARDRFVRYRSLKSFRKSQWDPKENLPESYSSIFHFSSFKATQRMVMAEMKDVCRAAEKCNGSFWGSTPNPTGGDAEMADYSEDDADDFLMGCVPCGFYIKMTLGAVSQNEFEGVAAGSLLSAVALLPHENKISVLHMGLSHGKNCDPSLDVPVKSKDVLTFRCGWRTWQGRPTFSQHNLNCDKHKFERFLPQTGSFFAASVFGPVTYTPCPVLVFRELGGRKELVATGSMIGADADRIVVKRIILTGYPVRVRKRFATVKYMFYDPEDVKWFKPAGITTKHGLNGKIEASVGEHGTMKCLFNAPIKQHDTVCLPLYKRVYPKFLDTKPTANRDDGGTVRTNSGRSTMIVK